MTYSNPNGTLPLPRQTGLPDPVWTGARYALEFSPVVAPDVDFQATWSSPIFDLRPGLQTISNNLVASRSSAVPIWRSEDRVIAPNLFVQVTWPAQPGGSPFLGLRVLGYTWAHINDVQQVTGISPAQDVTQAFVNAGQAPGAPTGSALTIWEPTGRNAPVRYWQVRIFFQVLTGNAPPQQPVTLTSALY